MESYNNPPLPQLWPRQCIVKLALHLVPTAAAPIIVIEYRPRIERTRPAKLGLITFDLDDSLHPIEPVLADANEVFVETVAQYGYSILPEDIVDAGKRVREEAGPVAGAAMTHTEVRMEAIRREMEK